MGIRRRRSKAVDVSSFLLFEATGDSESGCSSDPAMVDISHDDGGDDDDDDDDAESCSCDTAPDVVHGVREIGGSLKNKFANVVEGVDDEDDDDDDDDDDDGVVEQKEVQLYKKGCRDDERIKGVGVGKEKKSSSSAENSSETMNEMEKNRLFWETCLAS